MAPNVIHKGHDFESSRSLGKIIGTIRFLDLKNIDLDITQNVILSALVQKLWSKTSFCIMVDNVMRSRTSHTQAAQIIFLFVKRPLPKLSCVKNWQHFVH